VSKVPAAQGRCSRTPRGVQVVAALALAVSGLAALPPSRGDYSQEAVAIWDSLPSSVSHIGLTDGQSTVEATRSFEAGVRLRVSGRIGKGAIAIGPGVGSELLWSPDSKAFAITTSDVGRNGPFRVLVVSNEARGLTVTDISPLIVRTFGQPTRCVWPERPNVSAITWTKDSERLVVAAEIVRHSNCDSYGTFRAYEVDWRKKQILRSFGQIEAKRVFARSIGSELKAANDECIRRPRRCWVRSNHPEIQ
jgi:hypothetical protein